MCSWSAQYRVGGFIFVIALLRKWKGTIRDGRGDSSVLVRRYPIARPRKRERRPQ